MKQVVAIHGGDSFATYDEYIAFLKSIGIESLDNLRSSKDWKRGLQETLGTEYDVLLPRMPNGQNAKYLEWKIWFEKLIPVLAEEVILIGHSLGGSFLAKYLSSEQFPKKILGVFLVAAPYDTDGPRKLVEFDVPHSLPLLEKQSATIFLYHSKDDPVVGFSELAKYRAALPHATVRIFEDRKHFNQESFPELVADIKSL